MSPPDTALRPTLRPTLPATLDAIVRAHVAEMEAMPVRTEPRPAADPSLPGLRAGEQTRDRRPAPEPLITESEYRLLDGNR